VLTGDPLVSGGSCSQPLAVAALSPHDPTGEPLTDQCPAGPRPSAWRRRLRLLSSLLCGLSLLPLAGCLPGASKRPLVLYVAATTPAEERITPELAHIFQGRFRQLVDGFRQLHPHVVVQISLYPEEQLLPQIRRRTASGLGPDLIVTAADPAHRLLHQGLTVPMPLAREDASAIDPLLLSRLVTPSGQIIGMPLVLYTQMACFDRRRVSAPPTTVQELLQQSAAGVRVGLALRLRDLFWSAGSLGALPAMRAASEGRELDAAQRRGLRDWFHWLQSANVQKDVTFVEASASLRDGFRRGRFDWISCNSSDLPLLSAALGEHLGISTLPGGDGLPATPVNGLRVVTLGRNSSGEQRQMAIALSRYSLRPMVQRSFTLENQVFLPVNRHVTVPVQSSQALATLVAAGRQGEGVAPLLARLHEADPRANELEEVIMPLVFGMTDPQQAVQDSLRILRRP